tara:strand:+ start:124 stop:273 length:150 start_codon:yes stop_codon:yes gene_type:complete
MILLMVGSVDIIDYLADKLSQHFNKHDKEVHQHPMGMGFAQKDHKNDEA